MPEINRKHNEAIKEDSNTITLHLTDEQIAKLNIYLKLTKYDLTDKINEAKTLANNPYFTNREIAASNAKWYEETLTVINSIESYISSPISDAE